jgi:hypothetical protein
LRVETKFDVRFSTERRRRRVGKRRVAVLVHYNKVSNFGNEENSVDWKKKADFTDFS